MNSLEHFVFIKNINKKFIKLKLLKFMEKSKNKPYLSIF